jgi:hypothetical protein
MFWRERIFTCFFIRVNSLFIAFLLSIICNVSDKRIWPICYRNTVHSLLPVCVSPVSWWCLTCLLSVSHLSTGGVIPVFCLDLTCQLVFPAFLMCVSHLSAVCRHLAPEVGDVCPVDQLTTGAALNTWWFYYVIKNQQFILLGCQKFCIRLAAENINVKSISSSCNLTARRWRRMDKKQKELCTRSVHLWPLVDLSATSTQKRTPLASYEKKNRTTYTTTTSLCFYLIWWF